MTVQKGSTRSAYQQIRQAIVEGAYEPGQRLIEQRVAEEFSLSRTPVREALRMLEAEGLVHSEPNRMTAVRSFSPAEISDLYELRARLEAYAAELAAERAQPEHLEQIDAGLAEFSHLISPAATGELEAIRALNLANEVVHRTIMEAAAHSRLAQLLARTVDVPLVFQAFRQFDRSRFEQSHLFHELIRDAIGRRDGARAARLMSEHVLQGRDVLLASIKLD